MALTLPVDRFSVPRPVQFTFNKHSRVLTVLYNVHMDPSDGYRVHWCLLPPQVHHQLLCLGHIKLQMMVITPCDKFTRHIVVLRLITTADASNHRRVVRVFLEMARLCVAVEVCGVDGEEEGKEDCPLWGPNYYYYYYYYYYY